MGNKKTRMAARAPIYDSGHRLSDKLLNGQEMTAAQDEELHKMAVVWKLLQRHPKSIVKKKLEIMYGMGSSNAFRLIRHTEEFFVEIDTINEKVERLKQKKRLEGIVYNDKYPIDARLKAEKLLSEILGTKQDGSVKAPKKRTIVRRTRSPQALIEEVINEE